MSLLVQAIARLAGSGWALSVTALISSVWRFRVSEMAWVFRSASSDTRASSRVRRRTISLMASARLAA